MQKKATPTILEVNPLPTKDSTTSATLDDDPLSTKDSKTRATRQTSRVGRKSKPASEKESKLVGIMLTPGEYENLKLRAGLTPAAAILKDHLRRNTEFFEPMSESS